MRAPFELKVMIRHRRPIVPKKTDCNYRTLGKDMDHKKHHQMQAQTNGRYLPSVIFLHWLLAVALVGMIPLGWYMTSIEDDPGSDWYFDLHKSIGLIVAALILIRIVLRLRHRPAPLPGTTPIWQRQLSTATHRLLYACMVIMPITGYIGASFSKEGLRFFGSRLPVWATTNKDISEFFFSIHSITTWVLVVLISLHVLAGLKHLFIDRDGVFQRMWP